MNVLSYNAWDLPLGLTKDRKARILGLCDTLRQASEVSRWDAILLQEVWTPNAARILSHCGYPYAARADKGYFQSGLMILSLHPIVDIREIHFPNTPTSWSSVFTGEWIARKGALSVVLEPLGGKRIRLVNTHLAANYGPKQSFSAHRRAQLQMLSTWVGGMLRAEPLILGGDFNLAPQFRNHDPLWEELPRFFPAFTSAPYPDGTCTFCETNRYAGETQGKLDHIWAGPGVQPLRASRVLDQEGEVFSDHYGWESRFSF